MTKRPSLSLSTSFLSLFLLLGCMSENQRQQAAADELGPVDLRPGMSFGELKKVLREETPEILGGGGVRNVTQVAFRHRIIYAYFLRENFAVSSPPEDSAVPIRLQVYRPFRGTICGMSIDMTYDDALEKVKTLYPRAQIEVIPITRINLNGTPRETWFLRTCSLQVGRVRVDGLEVETSGYSTIPG